MFVPGWGEEEVEEEEGKRAYLSSAQSLIRVCVLQVQRGERRGGNIGQKPKGGSDEGMVNKWLTNPGGPRLA